MAGFTEIRDHVSIEFGGHTAHIIHTIRLTTANGRTPSGEDPQSSVRPLHAQDEEEPMEWEYSDTMSNVAPTDDEIPMDTD